MAKRRRVALRLELDWPFKRHHGVFAGTQAYAEQCEQWECTIDPHPELVLKGNGSGRGYDGIIARVTPSLAVAARQVGVPLVNVWANSPVTGVPLVSPDFGQAGRLAATHLMARGFRTFGYLGFSRQRTNTIQRKAFEAAVSEAGFSCSSLTVPSTYKADAAKWQVFSARLDEWIDSWPLPIGVYITYDTAARYLATACRRKGVHVPRDVALVGAHNDVMICAHPAPSLSSVEMGYERVGFRAAQLLDEMMDGAPGPTEPILIEPTGLVARQSSDVMAVDDPIVARALGFMSDHSHEPITIADIAAEMHVTRRTVERRFRDVLGRSIKDELVRLRVERAKRLLVESRTPIKRLAAKAGFSDARRMYEIFLRVEGVPPSDYRRQRRRK